MRRLTICFRKLFLERMEKLVPKATGEEGCSLPQGPEWQATIFAFYHAQRSLHAALLQPERPNDGRYLYEIESIRHFARFKLVRLPNETTKLKFRHFLERQGLGEVLFSEVNKHLEKSGLTLREGSIVDATILSAPKNDSGQRDPEMHQTRKGNQWHFGMRTHLAVEDTLSLIHSIDSTAANVHDIVPIGSFFTVTINEFS